MQTLRFKSEKIVGRNSELEQLKGVSADLEAGKGRTILVSGEAGIGKTRLMNETINYMEKQGIRTIGVYCLPHENTDSYLPFTEILHEIAPDEQLIPAHEEWKPISIDEVFLIHKKNGVLIAHTSKKDRGLDSDVVAGMFTAVQDFVKDSFVDKDVSTGSGLRRLEYRDMNILIEHGRNIFIASLLVGPTATKTVYRDLRSTVEIIEKDYQDVLEDWDGNLGRIRGTETVLKMLTSKNYPVEKLMDKNMLDAERLRVFEHVLNIVTNTSKEKPLLLFFDDLQWADPSSLQLLHYLSRNTKEYPVLLCGAYRPEELVPTPQGKTHPLKETISLMSREELITMIPLDRLKDEDTVEIIKSIFAHSFNPKFTERIQQETEGNPFFMEELLRALVLDGIIYRTNAVWEAKDLSKLVIPSAVRDAVMRRVSALDADCQEVLKYAAITGQIFQFQTLAKTAGKDRKTLAELLEKIEKQGIIRSEKNIISFDHAKLQEVIYTNIPEYRRSILHEETAQTIEELNKENLASVAVELAHHYQQAGIVDKTAEYALLAGEKAEKKFTPIEAVQHYMTALQALEKLKPIFENKEKQLNTADKIAYMYYIIGDWDASLNYVYLVGKLAKETGNQAIVAESYRNMGMIHIDRADYDRAREELQRALKISEEINDAQGMAEAHFWLGKACWMTGKLDESAEHLKACLNISEKLGDERLRAMTWNDIGVVHKFKGEYEKSLKLRMKCLEYFERTEDKYELARAQNNIGATYSEMNDYRKAIEWFEKCIKICRDAGIIRVVGYGLANAAEDYAELGEELEKAKSYVDEALEIFQKLGEKRMIGSCHGKYGIIYHKKKEWGRASEEFEKCIKIAEEVEDLETLSSTHQDYGRMFADKGDKAKAREQFEKSIAVYEKLGNKVKVEEVKKELEKL